MARLLMKPVHWNPAGYHSPAGRRATSGFPKDWGFGHEEWNNSDRMMFIEQGVRCRAFHTEPAGSPPIEEASHKVVFMYASHNGVQELVGIAAQATDLTENPKRRAEIRSKVDFNKSLDDILELTRAGRLPLHDVKAMEKKWRSEEKYLPRWMCPDDHYMWLDRPVRLDAEAIRGTSKFLTMFGSYTALDTDEAIRIMNFVPSSLRRPAWYLIRDAIYDARGDLEADIEAIEKDRSVTKTTREQLIQARCGQGRFRQGVLDAWEGRCAVTGCGLTEALRASHIRSWRESSNEERLDSDNGLPLVASIDALFDKALITFSDNGAMQVAPGISQEDRRILGVPVSLRKGLGTKQRAYMATHRELFMQRTSAPEEPDAEL